jgi:predicted dehydrogenase
VTTALLPHSGSVRTRPRLGFLGVGWIGRHRMEAIAESGVAEIVAIADPDPMATAAAGERVPGTRTLEGLDELLEAGVDGVVIATPSAEHAEQAIAALDRGLAVFCQKPLARTAAETRTVIDAARAADRLLGVDLSYRFTAAARAIRQLVRAGELGDVFAVDLVFHNAYGPDKPWFRDMRLSGGGCVMDLGIHLVDLLHWTLGTERAACVESRLYAGGQLLGSAPSTVEDFAVATLHLPTGATARLACSWNLHAGRDAVIGASFFGTKGGATLRNVNGSFHDFIAERHSGTSTTLLAQPPDDWGGRAAVAWAEAVAAGAGFDAGVEASHDVALTLDAIYGR